MSYPRLFVRQRKELAELFGFETRNKYEIKTQEGHLVLYCAEQQKGFLGFLSRQFLGHWRRFELHFFDSQKNLVWKAVHPFRFIFQRLDVEDAMGHPIGSVEWRWGLLRKRFGLTETKTGKTYDINSGFFSFWTFPVTHMGMPAGSIQKKWSGLFQEALLDADNFLVEFSHHQDDRGRALMLSAAVLVDLNYFEKKGSGGGIGGFSD